MHEIEPITIYLKRKLKEAGAARFDAIANAAGVNASFIRKFFYGSRENPRIQTVQPLIDYFKAVERGENEMAGIKTKATAQMGGQQNSPVPPVQPAQAAAETIAASLPLGV